MAWNSDSGFGFGFGFRDGDGSGSGYGSGFGDGDGYGSGYGFGDGYGEQMGSCGKYEAVFIVPWQLLRIGCEIHSLDEWIRDADTIDACYGDGIASQTRSLAAALVSREEKRRA